MYTLIHKVSEGDGYVLSFFHIKNKDTEVRKYSSGHQGGEMLIKKASLWVTCPQAT